MAGVRFNPDGLALSEGYAQTMEQAVLPYINARRTDATVAGDGGRPLFTSRFDADAPRGTVLLVHGFTESADKFAELIHSLLRNGYSAVAYDQRGHARSWRDPALGDDLSLTHVDDFEEYVRDLEKVVEGPLSQLPKPWLLFAHSMGGAVSSLYLERHPGVFSRAALCAPMIAPNLGGLTPGMARALCAVEGCLGRSRKRIFASKPYAGPEDFATSAATDPQRFAWYDAIKAADPAFSNNGPTYGWVRESVRATRLLLAPGAPEGIDAAVLLFTAENDGSVMPGPQEAFAARLKNGRRELVKGAKHEIFRSTDAVLFPWWREVLDFYEGRERGA